MAGSSEFDAIVIGSGITGGLAAKELTEKGLKVLMLDRGTMVEHNHYPTEHIRPWEIPFGGLPDREANRRDYFIQSTNFLFDTTVRHFWINDRLNPYVQTQPFKWLRSDVVGGRSLTWGRQSYRWSDLDFGANKRDGHGNDWPIRYADIKDWYSYVERFTGISGEKLELPQLPDSDFQPPMQMNAAEKAFKQSVETRFPGRNVTVGRVAVLTEPLNGRAACHYCGPCERGCSTRSYFSTQTVTLPAAMKTGNLELRADSVVDGIDYDPATRRVTSVRVIDANSGKRTSYSARLIFLCASSVNSVQIMLNSPSEAFPNGLANSSGVLGRYFMDHIGGGGARGELPGLEGRYYYGFRPNGIIIPRFRNLDGQDADADFVRGYGYQGGGWVDEWKERWKSIPGFGEEFKNQMRKPGPWRMSLGGFGEMLPYADNTITLDKKRDRFGMPLVRFDVTYRENERRMREDHIKHAVEMLKAVGATNITTSTSDPIPGMTIHEMGGARMGADPTESVLNAYNQSHDIPNLFVTDGACMCSTACVNPSLTYMALTARAADYAVTQLKANKI